MNNNTVIEVSDVTKIYKVYKEPKDRIKEMLPFFYVFKSKIRIVRMISDEFVRNRKDDFG